LRFRSTRRSFMPIARPPYIAAMVALLLLALSGTAPASSTPDPPAPDPAAMAAADLTTGMALPSGARLLRVRRVADRTLDVTLQSPALGGEGHARILVPPDYAGSRGRRWPVLYLLHGCCFTAPGWTLWTTQTDVERQTAQYDALVVMPDGGSHGFYSDWWNGGRNGPPAWETFHLTELRQFLEYGLHANRRISIAGFSMGGFGALSYAARHPGMFRAAASYSGLTDSRAGSANVLAVLEGMGEDPLALWGDLEEQAGIWRQHNPADLVARLRGMPLYVSAGDGRPGPLDPPGQTADPLEGWVGPMNARFVELARANHVRLTAHLYGPGTHSWTYWEREMHLSLPLLMDVIKAESAHR
jgi:diacylglycerol O-acyltransferase/trehalose O-mycolyltransferase